MKVAVSEPSHVPLMLPSDEVVMDAPPVASISRENNEPLAKDPDTLTA